jgi:hypothetical protein
MNKTPPGHMKLEDSWQDSLLTTEWLRDLLNKIAFIFKTLEEIKLCTFVHNTMEAQDASADSSNCHILHKLLGKSVSFHDFRKSENEVDLLTSPFSSAVEKLLLIFSWSSVTCSVTWK